MDSIDDMKKRYLLGESASSIAKSYGVQHHMVEKWLKKEGIKMRGMTAFGNVDEHFFDIIDTEEKAYWLGMLASDGYVRGRGVIGLSLKISDRGLIERFVKSIKYKGRINVMERVRGSGSIEKCSYVSFRSVVMKKSLERYGVVERKSKILKINFTYIPDEFLNHFWRGMIDGDGSLGGELGNTSLSLVGTYDVCFEFSEFIYKRIGIRVDVKNADGEGDLKRIILYGENSVKMANIIYKDSKVYMDRKMAIAAEWCGFSQNIEVNKISKEEAIEFFKRYHYLHGMSSYSVPYGGKICGNLVGVAAIGVSSSDDIQKSVFGKENKNRVRELTRFCVNGGQKNLSSMFLSKVIKKIGEDYPDIWALVSFADVAQGHYGGIYQACGARYVGKSDAEMVYVIPNGERLTGRYVLRSLESKGISLSEVKIERSEGKMKYILFVDKNSESRCLLNSMPYIKSLNK
jgi:hypothetical protein